MNKLQKKIDEKNIKKKGFSEDLGISSSYYSRKIQNLDKFTVSELKKIKKILNLSGTELLDIFDIK